MRVFYIFDIKEEFIALYNGHESVLFAILKQLYYMDKDDISYGYNIFYQLTNKIDKEKLDRILFLKMHLDIPYSKRGNCHRVNNLYKDEISILEVKNAYIKIQVEQNYCSFFNQLEQVSSTFFVCDFKNIEYFFIDRRKSLV